MSQYYQGNPKSATENKIKAQQVLAVTWKNRIYNGSFTIYHADCREGEKVIGGQAVADVLQTIVTTKFKYVFDFNRGVNENQLKVTQLKSAAKCGIVKATSGVMSRAEKSVLAEVWEQDNYWTNPTTSGLNISIIKRDIEALIDENFKKEGQISIDDIYSHLESDYGFAPCNLSAFLLGFMLKEYGGEPYRYLDSSGSHDVMSSDKLSEMIGNYINGKSNPTYIVKMTPEEMAFYEVTEKAWGLEPNACAHINQAQVSVKNKMQSLRLPVWSLKNVDDAGVYDFVEKYIELIQKEGKEAHKVALSIGSASVIKPSLGENLAKLLTPEKCQEGMKYYLQAFEDGKLLSLASEIGAEETMLADISQLFSVAYRVKGIIEALKDNRELEDEEVPVIFIAHKNDDAGKRRTRKLFSTLNRRAKPVGDNYQIALDEDDIAAIVTREVVEEYELFQKERLLNAKKKQIPKTNVNAFTSLIALYHCNEYLIKDKLGLSDTQFKGYKLYRPDEKVIEDMLSYVESFWTSFIDNITVIKEYLSEDEKPALRYRNDKGGNLLFRPIGILEFVKAAVIISKRQNKPFGDVLKEMNKIQLELDSSAWRGVVWDGKKIINRANLNLVRLMIMNLVQDFELSDKEKEQLKDLFISATNFEGDTDSVWDKIMEIKKASSTNTSI